MTKVPAVLIGVGMLFASVALTTIERIYGIPAAILTLSGYFGVGTMICGFMGYQIQEVKEGDPE